ncbi:chitobiase/beta-hexosaminidase C-terminal domain-containing protein, partial [Wenyingzhuangia sp.]|uniref:chitobiase/beta-hexosaminidase C-terminal domain-containing protein n=1 Tax=Wenyingzhuangia sp. TaxID=1964193 RepID=UPI00321A8088
MSAVFSSPSSVGVEPPAILGLSTNNFHTNFKISSTSETLILTDNTGTLIDEITAEKLPPNTSIGVSESSENVVTYLETTPGSENSNNEFLGAVQSEVLFSQEGGLINGPVSLILSGNNSEEFIRYTLDGSAPSESS